MHGHICIINSSSQLTCKHIYNLFILEAHTQYQYEYFSAVLFKVETLLLVIFMRHMLLHVHSITLLDHNHI